MAAAVTPFPTEETTPPVKNKYFVVIFSPFFNRPCRLYKGSGEGSKALPTGDVDVSWMVSDFSSYQFRQVFGGPAHFQKDQPQFCLLAGQGRQHGFLADGGQDDRAGIAFDIDLLKALAPQFS